MAKRIASEAAERRVALVIGIERYRAARELANPVRDARMVAAALDGLGFAVAVATDPTQRRLAAALDRFERVHRGAHVALLFFAGHGVQIGGRNFLLPTDAKTASAAALESSSLSLDAVFARIAATAPRRIMLLDACRNDPFGAAADAAAADAGRGLKVREGAPAPIAVPGLGRMGRADGTIYVFATAPGTTAADGVGDHSPFTQALLASLGRQGLDFSIVMKTVQQDVYLRTAGRQVPYIEDALPDPPVFADVGAAAWSERERFLVRISKIGPDTRSQVERIAAASGIPLAPLYAALLAAEADGMLDYPAREKRLARAAEEFVKARADLQALASADPEVSRLRAAAEHDLSLGHFEAARAALTQAIEVDRASAERIEARLKERKLSAAASLAARAGIARTRLDYPAAAADYAAAAELVLPFDRQLAWRYTRSRADNLRDCGKEFGDKAALAKATAAYRDALALVPRALAPDDWAATQNGLGRALFALGENESGTARLEQAVAAFRAALEHRRRDDKPLAWAETQNNLAVALQTLGEREGGTARLDEAVEAFRAALAAYPRAHAPLAFAATQNNLGATLKTLGERERGTARFVEAVEAFRAALTEQTRARAPLAWARTQNNLGATLHALGERAARTSLLEEAVEAFRAALMERTRARVPPAWARTQNNLGAALRSLGAREEGTRSLEGAVSAIRAALEELTHERMPLDWADAQRNLGSALDLLGERRRDITLLEEAAAAYRAALREWTRKRFPLDWAQTVHALAQVELTIARSAASAPRKARLTRARRLATKLIEMHRQAGAPPDMKRAERLVADIDAALARAGGANIALAATRC